MTPPPRLYRTRFLLLVSVLITLPTLLHASPLPPSAHVPSFAESNSITAERMTPEYWIARLPDPGRVRLDVDAVAGHNARMRKREPSLHDLRALPPTLARTQVQAWIEDISRVPSRPLYIESGTPLGRSRQNALLDSLNLDGIAPSQPTRYGIVVRRAALRAFPTELRVFRSPDDSDIDRFQESALFPGTAVAVVHRSQDGRWLFVVSETYAAWIERDAVALGDRDQVFAYADKHPFLVVTGAKVHTVYTPERPQLSRLQLDMGVRVPLLAQWPVDMPVNGQHPLFGHVVELPVRGNDGRLSFAPALVPRSADVATGHLALTEANLITQAFKFLGERYGWGHSYEGRDCSGFVSEIYRSMGIVLPRNTSAQSISPGMDRIALTENTSHAERLGILSRLQVGDLIYIPGHVMMVIGREQGETWVIHDTTGMRWMRADGSIAHARLNGVSVTPLSPMLFGETGATIDHITNIQQIRP